MNKKIKKIITVFFLVGILILPYFVFAADIMSKLETAGGGAYDVEKTNEYTMSEIIGTVVSAFLSLLGIIFIVLILYAGYNWMVSSGNEEKINKAKSTLLRATIGLIIVTASYAIWAFVYAKLIDV